MNVVSLSLQCEGDVFALCSLPKLMNLSHMFTPLPSSYPFFALFFISSLLHLLLVYFYLRSLVSFALSSSFLLSFSLLLLLIQSGVTTTATTIASEKSGIAKWKTVT